MSSKKNREWIINSLLVLVAGLLIVAILFLSGCYKQESTITYENTIEEALQIVNDRGIHITIEDLYDYRNDRNVNRTLADSLVNPNDYICITYQKDEGSKIWYVEDNLVIMDFLIQYGLTGTNVWDTNDDQTINTSDLITILTGYNTSNQNQPDFNCYDPVFSFGEGNTQLTYLCNNKLIFFGWFHRSPYDEEYYPEDTNSLTYELYSFEFDEVQLNEINFYTYIKP